MMLCLYRVEGKEPLGTKELTEIMVKAKERQSLVNLFVPLIFLAPKFIIESVTKLAMG